MDSFFKITERGSTVGREIRGGVVTFIAMAYIIALNPLILGLVADSEGKFLGGGDAPNLTAIAAGTALVAGILTILMGVVANFPMALAAGLGLNAFVAFGIATQATWADAMGLVVIEGIIILILVMTGFREAVFHAVPAQLKVAISVGIGLFIALVGLVSAGWVRKGEPLIELGIGGSLDGWPSLVFGFGLLLVILLWVRKVNGALLIGIVVTTVVAILLESFFKIGPTVLPDGEVNPKGWNLNVPELPGSVKDLIQLPDFGTLGQFNLLNSWQNLGIVTTLLLIFTLLLADFFDTMGTMTAIAVEGDLLDDDGLPPNTERILIVDSIAAAAGGAAGVSSNTSYIESAAGVGEGARTGLASVVTGVLFLVAVFLAPLVNMIPSEAAVPALVFVGFLMMQQVTEITWDDLDIAIPAFLTIILMPFTYSISVGIGAGFIAYTFIKVVRGKISEIHPMMWLVSVLFVLYFAIEPIKAVLT